MNSLVEFPQISSWLSLLMRETSLCSAYKYIKSFSQLFLPSLELQGSSGGCLKGKKEAKLLGEASAALNYCRKNRSESRY